MDGRRDHDEPTVAAESFSSFLERIGRVPLLTPLEESLLARRAADGDRDAQRILLERNLRLVVWIAKRYCGRGLPMSDLVQEGTLGLIRAIERFDWRRGCRLSTYATWWIRAAVEHAVESPGVTLVSLDDETRDGVRRFVHGLPDPAADDPFSGLDRQARAEAVRSASAALPELMRVVVELRFGLAGAPLSHPEIAERFGLSEPVIRGLERRALERLRFALVAAA